MKVKQDDEYFEQLDKKPFNEFIHDYINAHAEYAKMLEKVWAAVEAGEDASKNHLFKMRGKTIDLQKFGKQFRERTVLMEKAN
jgi:hypothetical protein